LTWCGKDLGRVAKDDRRHDAEKAGRSCNAENVAIRPPIHHCSSAVTHFVWPLAVFCYTSGPAAWNDMPAPMRSNDRSPNDFRHSLRVLHFFAAWRRCARLCDSFVTSTVAYLWNFYLFLLLPGLRPWTPFWDFLGPRLVTDVVEGNAQASTDGNARRGKHVIANLHVTTEYRPIG